MVCIAIMGVMATIAVPNMTMMADRAHQNEAKIELAAIYATEKTFFSEFRFYTYCLFEAGYLPENQARYYTVGFINGRGCGYGKMCQIDDMKPTPASCDWTSVAWSGSSHNPATFGANRSANPALAGWGVPGHYDIPADNVFKAVAFGSVSGKSRILDVWSIENLQSRINEQPGL